MIEPLETRRLLAFPAQALSFGDLGTISHSTNDIRNGFIKLPNERFLGYGNSRLAMYHNDGTLDSTFGGTGTRKLAFPARDGDLSADGKMIFIGAKQHDYTVSVARLNPDGSYDTTFAEDGRLHIQFPGRPLIYKTSLFTTNDGGAILVVSHFLDGLPDSQATVMFKVSATGEFDPALSHKLFQGLHNDIEPIPGGNGAFYVAGKSPQFGNYVARINAGGALDETFDRDTLKAEAEPQALAIDADGKVLVAAGDLPTRAALARLNTDGSLDSTFSGDGKIDLTQSGQDVPPDVDVTAGKISLLYAFQNIRADRIYRFNADGTPDTTFGEAGIFNGPDDFRGARQMLVLDDGSTFITTAFNTIRRFDDSPDLVVKDQTAFVRGSNVADTLTVAAGASAGAVKITFNGIVSGFLAGEVTRLAFLGQDGNDDFLTTLDLPSFTDAGAGNDTIRTAGGDDTVLPGLGNDSINTAAGDDSVEGDGSSSDEITLGDGDDTVRSASGSIDAGAGDDRILGSSFRGPIIGGDGNDQIEGGGDGPISGGAGNDTIVSTSGFADIDGGDGDDAIDVTNAGGNPLDPEGASATILGGTGNDIISLTTGEYVADAGAGNDLIRCAGRFEASLEPGSLIIIDRSALHGGDGSDTIFSGPGTDSIYGGAGNDRIYSEQVGDFISAGGGNDVVRTDNVAVSVNGGAGNDRVYSRYPSEFIGGDGDDFVDHARAAWGGRGNDTLHSAGGAEATLMGGPGDDVFFSNDGARDDTLDGGGGNDTATADDDDVLTSIETVL